jgi:AcrR family transcriptional regulator
VPAARSRPAAPERRDEIVRAAMECFAARGFSGTTTREIATRVGITEALQADPAFFRILLYTALEGHSLAEPFFRQRTAAPREFLSGYIARRTREGAFRELDPVLAARAFIGMVWDYVLVRELFQQKESYPISGEAAADTFVSIFLDGMTAVKEDRRG